MNISWPLLTATTILATSTNFAFAATEPFFEILVMGGIATLDATDTSLQISDSETDKLIQTNDGNWESWTGQVGVGYVSPLTHELQTGDVQWFPLITPQINLYYLDGDDIQGDVYQFESADFDNLDYNMDFQSTRLMFDLGLTLAAIDRFSVYAIAGAGIAWNKTDLNANPNQQGIDCGAIGFDIDSKTSSSFAYEFGGGMTYAAMDNLAISLEYLYTGFTDVELGNDSDEFDIESQDLDINSQAVLLGLRFAL
ncbi:MAG: outer membrane beta-barrel protein [Legionellales bacterium]|jgi:opacity protein-like surface antigen